MKESEVNKKKITIAGISLWRICAYFIIYSFVGFIVETCFGVITKGELESRQSFLYGPFCRNIWCWCNNNDINFAKIQKK